MNWDKAFTYLIVLITLLAATFLYTEWNRKPIVSECGIFWVQPHPDSLILVQVDVWRTIHGGVYADTTRWLLNKEHRAGAFAWERLSSNNKSFINNR